MKRSVCLFILIGFLVIFLASCATPKIFLKSTGVSMELRSSAYFVKSITFSPDGKYVLSGGLGGKVRLWDVSTGKGIKTLWRPSSFLQKGVFAVNSVAFSPDGRYVLGGWYDTLKLLDVATGEEIKTFRGHAGGFGDIGSAAFSPKGRYVLSAGDDAAIRCWDVFTGEEIATMVGFEDGNGLLLHRRVITIRLQKGTTI